MTTRIPPSLKWLIDKRARLDGEIQKTKEALTRIRTLVNELKSVERELASIDSAMRLHSIEVNSDLIQPVRSHYNRIKAPHGLLTRLILHRLRMAKSESVTTADIVLFVSVKFSEEGIETANYEKLRKSVRYRLKDLVHDGIVFSHHPKSTSKMGRWSLAENKIKD